MKRKLVFICLMGILVTLTVNAQPKVVAHRGYWDIEGSAQNSIRALIKADSIQCDACEYLPSLDQFLDVAKRLTIDLVLEIKPHKNREHEKEAVKMILDLVKAKELETRTSYITFSRNAFDELVKQTNCPILYLNGVAPDVLKKIGGTGADYHINVFKKNPEWIKQLHDSGLEVNIWTVSEPEEIQWCIDHGADYITTNNPELVQKMIKDPL